MERILLVTTSYPERDEGAAAAGTFVRDFAFELSRQGIEVEVVAPARDEGVTMEGGIKVRRFAVPKLPLSLLDPLSLGDWPAIGTTLKRGALAVQEACEAARPLHILALWALPSGAWARLVTARVRPPYSTWALGSDIWSLGRIPLIRGYLRRVLRGAVVNFADGYELAGRVEGITGRRCHFLPSCRKLDVSAEKVLRHVPPYRLSFLGRWHPNKGIDLLLDALDTLGPGAWAAIDRVRIYGGGPLEAMVKSRVAKLVAMGRPVELGGYVDKEQATALLLDTDYLLLPSRIESIPVIFSDAMQTLCPIVTMPVGDLPRLVRAFGVGEMADGVSASDFAAALARLLTRCPVDFADGMAQAAHEFRVETSVSTFLRQIGYGGGLNPASGR